MNKKNFFKVFKKRTKKYFIHGGEQDQREDPSQFTYSAEISVGLHPDVWWGHKLTEATSNQGQKTKDTHNIPHSNRLF